MCNLPVGDIQSNPDSQTAQFFEAGQEYLSRS